MSQFTQPEVYVGMNVAWYPHKGSTPFAGLVTAVGTRTVSVNVYPPGYVNAMCMEGTMHVSDPLWANAVDNETGLWDYSEWDKSQWQNKGKPKKAQVEEPASAGF